MSNSFPEISKEDLQRLVGAPVEDESLYIQALRHGSLFRGDDDSYLLSNERLEYLGDAIVDFVVAEALYIHFADRDEGFLTRVRARIVSGAALAQYAARIGLGDFILMSSDMERSGGRANASILAGAFEALVAAVYLDRGDEAVRSFLQRVVLDEIDLDDVAGRRDNYKSILLEYAQARGWAQPSYRVVEEEGPPHARMFTTEVVVESQPSGRGRAGSKKMAEQKAAKQALEKLQAEEKG